MRRPCGGAVGSTAVWSTAEVTAATVSEPNSAIVSSTEGPHRPRCWEIIALRPRIGVYTATPSTCSKCETSAATGLPIETPDTAITVDCGRSQRTRARTSETTRIMPATLVNGSMFG